MADRAEPVTSPDSRPAIRLRVELNRDRRLGVPWPDAWSDDVWLAVSGFDRAERLAWLEVFDATAEMWRRAYLREPLPTLPTRDLLESSA